jgi:hypothetical protein
MHLMSNCVDLDGIFGSACGRFGLSPQSWSLIPVLTFGDLGLSLPGVLVILILLFLCDSSVLGEMVVFCCLIYFVSVTSSY